MSAATEDFGARLRAMTTALAALEQRVTALEGSASGDRLRVAEALLDPFADPFTEAAAASALPPPGMPTAFTEPGGWTEWAGGGGGLSGGPLGRAGGAEGGASGDGSRTEAWVARDERLLAGVAGGGLALDPADEADWDDPELLEARAR